MIVQGGHIIPIKQNKFDLRAKRAKRAKGKKVDGAAPSETAAPILRVVTLGGSQSESMHIFGSITDLTTPIKNPTTPTNTLPQLLLNF